MTEKESQRDRLLKDDLIKDGEKINDLEVAKKLLEENVVIVTKNLIKDYEIGDFTVSVVVKVPHVS